MFGVGPGHNGGYPTLGQVPGAVDENTPVFGSGNYSAPGETGSPTIGANGVSPTYHGWSAASLLGGLPLLNVSSPGTSSSGAPNQDVMNTWINRIFGGTTPGANSDPARKSTSGPQPTPAAPTVVPQQAADTSLARYDTSSGIPMSAWVSPTIGTFLGGFGTGPATTTSTPTPAKTPSSIALIR
jgi:hypothetical protein